MSEFDDDSLEEPTTEAVPQDFSSLPDWAQKEIKRKRQAEQSLRGRLAQLESEALSAKFSSDLVELLPEEVTDYEKKVTYLARLQERLGAAPQQQEGQAEEAPPAPSPVEASDPRLAAVVQGPTSTENETQSITIEEFNALMATNPSEAVARARHVKFPDGRPNPLQTGRPEHGQGEIASSTLNKLLDGKL